MATAARLWNSLPDPAHLVGQGGKHLYPELSVGTGKVIWLTVPGSRPCNSVLLEPNVPEKKQPNVCNFVQLGRRQGC